VTNGFVFLIISATLFLRFHYTLDVIVAVPLAFASYHLCATYLYPNFAVQSQEDREEEKVASSTNNVQSEL